MAQCIPSSITEVDFDLTRGEKLVFDLLKRLPNDCMVWYEVVLHERSRKPDFIVLDPNRGICILEVKDWSVDAILEASRREFRIKWKDNPTASRQNPDQKCKIYLADAKELLSLCDELVDDRNRLVVPVDYLVVFPNIERHEFEKLGLYQVMDQERVIFKAEVNTPEAFISRFHNLLPKLQFRLSVAQILRVRRELKQEIAVTIPLQDNGLVKERQEEVVIVHDEVLPDRDFVIDIEQEKIAKSLREGPRLLRGFAGSGKTLIMLMRAKLFASNAAEQGKPQEVLILCWNISLANYMRQAFDNINIPISGGQIRITHFSEWARSLIRLHKGYRAVPKADSENFEEALTAQLTSISPYRTDKYDAIYIDEAQDFREEWLEFLFHKVLRGETPEEKNFVISADDAQRIYRHQGRSDFTWASLNIPMRGRSKVLRRVYRNSARVWTFAGFLLGNIAHYYPDDDGNVSANIEFAPKPGNDPQLIECKSPRDQIQEVIKTISEIIAQGYATRNVLILYRGVRVNGYPLVERLTQALERHAIPYQWITENAEAKATFRWNDNKVKISTVHSAKGMDAPVVIIIGAEAFGSQLETSNADEKKLMYVAMTRAREYLKILYTGDGGLIPYLKNCEDMYTRHRQRILKVEQMSLTEINL